MTIPDLSSHSPIVARGMVLPILSPSRTDSAPADPIAVMIPLGIAAITLLLILLIPPHA